MPSVPRTPGFEIKEDPEADKRVQNKFKFFKDKISKMSMGNLKEKNKKENKPKDKGGFFGNAFTAFEDSDYDITPDEYIFFVNKYIYPKIDKKDYPQLFFLSEHLKEQYPDLLNCLILDPNWISLSTMTKLAKLSARIDFRKEVTQDDIIKAYLITKHFLEQCYVYTLSTKKVKKLGKKGKIK